jgi:hypothetical protein
MDICWKAFKTPKNIDLKNISKLKKSSYRASSFNFNQFFSKTSPTPG